MAERSLPDLKTRVRVDRKELDALPGSAKKTGAALKGELGGASTSAKALETRLGALGGALTHLGPAGQIAGSALQDVTSAATALGPVGGVAVGALVGIAGAAIYAEGRYEKLVGEIDNYQDVTNSSAEQASRAVHMFDVLGISGETAAGAMFKLSRAIGEHPEKLRALGIEVQKDANGNTDLTETLYSVSDAYVHAGDASAKTAILFAAFGKGGASMIDVVERGSASLRELAASAKLVVTEADIERLRMYKIRQEELKSGWDEWVAALVQHVVPVLDEVVTRMNKNEYVTRRLKEALDAGTLSWGDFQKISLGSETAGNGVLKTLRAEYDASQQLSAQNSKLTQTIKEQTDKNNALVQSMNQVVGGLQAEESASMALRRANLAVSESQARIQSAAEAYDLAKREKGVGSPEAIAAYKVYEGALLDQEDAYYRAAEAARKYQEQLDLAAGGQLDAKKETEAYIAALQAEADSLEPGSPLQKNLQVYIDKLKNEIPSSVTTKFITEYTSIGMGPGGHGNQFFAGGGEPPVGRDVWVGEHGPELARFDSPATIYPHGQAPAGGGGGGDMSRVEALLEQSNALTRQLIEHVEQPYEEQTGDMSDISKLVRSALQHRMSGLAGA